MSTEVETVYEDRRGRMKLKIIRKPGKYGPQYSAMVYRVFKKEEDAGGNPVWEQTHWMDEQDVLNSLRLHQVADDAIAEMKRKESFGAANEAA
ncbi:MAG: hypothetical protein E2O59_00760 [Gammaproteobacteria bacterium]|nr:MAG: hypothetical protein E2O59_00760 [Gammaproteobacteria bacterium]